MPAVMDTPEGVEHEEYALYEEHDQQVEQPSVREAHPGFWRTVVQYLRRQRTHTRHDTPPSSHGALHPIETPAELLAREYPSLYIRAYAGV
jgi:hypothetical protein